MNEEKELIYQAEIAALKLQLDDAQAEIKHLNKEIKKATDMLLKRTRVRRVIKSVISMPKKWIKQ